MKLIVEKQAEEDEEAAAAAPAAKPKLGGSERALKLKALLKACTIRCVQRSSLLLRLASLTPTGSVSPSVYVKAAGDEGALCTLLEQLLAAEGLSADAAPAECAKVRRRKEMSRELEGIDASNIVSGRPRRAAAQEHAFMGPELAAKRKALPASAVKKKRVTRCV